MDDRKTILVVDDVEVNRKILSVILDNQYDVIEADSGVSAKRQLEECGRRISLILLDIVMPEMDGFTFLKYMHTIPAFRDIPVILVSAETYEENILNAVRYGVREIIAKPFSPELVLRRVENLIALSECGTAPAVSVGGSAAPQPDTVLIVEDVGINRVIIRNALEDQYDILEASNGKEALELLREHKEKIAIVLLDIIMPVMDGYQFMKLAKREKLIKNIPVMAITAEDSLQKLNTLMDLGICEIIQKPFTPGVIQNRVNYIVRLTEIGSAAR